MAYQTVKSVKKALQILDLLTDRALENKPLTLQDVAAETGILPVTARNLLRTLEEGGYARRIGHGKYEEGERNYTRLHAGGILRQLKQTAQPLMQRKIEELGESLLLVTIIDGKRVELLRCQAPSDRLHEPEWGANEDFYRMRTTRVLLAWFREEQMEYFVHRHGLPTPEEWQECAGTQEGLAKELSRIRTAGGCCDRHGQFAAVAVPILIGANECIASLGCYAPLARTDMARMRGIFSMLHLCAQEIREQL